MMVRVGLKSWSIKVFWGAYFSLIEVWGILVALGLNWFIIKR